MPAYYGAFSAGVTHRDRENRVTSDMYQTIAGSAVFHLRHQVFSVLAPFFGVLFERCEMSKLASISWTFFTLEKLYFKRAKISLPSLLLCVRFQAVFGGKQLVKTSQHTLVRVNNR